MRFRLSSFFLLCGTLAASLILAACTNPATTDVSKTAAVPGVLNPGSLDSSFPLHGISTRVVGGAQAHMALCPDGKILVASDFTKLGPAYVTGVARLSSVGAVDTGFHPQGTSEYDEAVALQSDGKILAGWPLVRLKTDGTQDTAFHTGTYSQYASFHALLVLPDDKILVGGNFQSYDGASRYNLVRLNSDGTLDTSFTVDMYGQFSIIYALASQADGKILVAGTKGTGHAGICRLDSSGNFDASFVPGTGIDSGAIQAVFAAADGAIFAGGTFTSFSGVASGGIVKLSSAGSVDKSFACPAVSESIKNALLAVSAFALGDGGKLYVGGCFDKVGSAPRANLARLNSDGSLDAAFDPGTIFGTGNLADCVSDLRLSGDGHLLVAGYSWYINSLPIVIARLNL